jgi:hypothetical protein
MSQPSNLEYILHKTKKKKSHTFYKIMKCEVFLF